MSAAESRSVESQSIDEALEHYHRCAAVLEPMFRERVEPQCETVSFAKAREAVQLLRLSLGSEDWIELTSVTPLRERDMLDFNEFQTLVRKACLISCGLRPGEMENLFTEVARIQGYQEADRVNFDQALHVEGIEDLRAIESIDSVLKQIGLAREIFCGMGWISQTEFEIVLAYEIDLQKRMRWLTERQTLRDISKKLPPSFGFSVSETIVNSVPIDSPNLDLDFSKLGQEILARARAKGDIALASSSAATNGSQASSKLAEDASELKYGTLEDFGKGLEGLVGEPMADIYEGMEAEHVRSADSETQFDPGNYLIITTPKAEFLAVTDAKFGEELNGSQQSKESGRRIPSREEWQAEGVRAGLIDSECLAVTLYTGPMFYKYNSLMRGFPGAVVEACRGNRYVNTIHLIVSGLRKLALVSPVPRGGVLYRGVRGLRLPDNFLAQDALNVSGGVERAFLSATDDRAVAIYYSRGPSGRQGESSLRMIFEFAVGSVDRPARIGKLSQFPDEGEFCFFPLAYLELCGRTRWEVAPDGGSLLVVPLRVNSNMTGLTLQQRLELRKNILLNIHRWTRVKLERDVWDLLSAPEAAGVEQRTREGFGEHVLREFDEVSARIAGTDPAVFNQDRHFKAGAAHILEMDSFARSAMALARLDPARFRTEAQTTRLRERHMELDCRLRDALAEAQGRGDGAGAAGPALQLCRMRSLFLDTLDERNECGDPPLVREAALGNLLNVRLLLAAGVDARSENSKKQSAVALAAANGHLECLLALMAAGGSHEAADDHGSTPLHRAAFNGRLDCVRALLEHGADAAATDAHFEETPLMKAAYGGHLGTVQLLLEHGAVVGLADKKGKTALFHAAKKGHCGCVELLVKVKADPRLQDRKSQTPLAVAREEGHEECRQLLERLSVGSAGVE